MEYYYLYKNVISKSKRFESIKINSFDIKYAYHLIRLLNEIEQILTEEDLDLERSREQLKSIRRGEWKMEDVISYAATKEKYLEGHYLKSKLPERPRELEVKNLLLECLEMQYGTLDKVVHIEDKYEHMIRRIKDIIDGN